MRILKLSEDFKANHKANFKDKYLTHLIVCQNLKKKYTGQLVRQPQTIEAIKRRGNNWQKQQLFGKRFFQMESHKKWA